ncbi:MAG: hypothetical protein KIH65_002220 [Candidatus Uhrbacteria bacterium]|nr:hypothetical protein [Candidatus Uhrbacteria bacterium]
MRTISDIPRATLDGFRSLIQRTIETASAEVEAERALGKELTNDPVAVMLVRPTPSPLAHPPNKDQEDFILYRDDRRIQSMRFTTGQNNYIDARNAWKAYGPIQKQLEALDWTEEEIYHVMMDIFPLGHHVYGVLTLLFHHTTDRGEGHVLMNIRGDKLAGTNVGYASFPGGLVKPGEDLETACIEELNQEGAKGEFYIFDGFTMGVHNAAPSITFMRAGLTTTDDIDLEASYDWLGKTTIWVPEGAVRSAIFKGDNTGLVTAFRDHELLVKSDLAIAPDAILPAKGLFEQFVF